MRDEDIVCLEGNGARPSHRGDGYSEGGVMYTLNSVEVHCVCYSIGAYNSKAWESDNPNSGIHEIQVSRTLDAINCGYPGCYQGGVAIIEIHKP